MVDELRPEQPRQDQPHEAADKSSRVNDVRSRAELGGDGMRPSGDRVKDLRRSVRPLVVTKRYPADAESLQLTAHCHHVLTLVEILALVERHQRYLCP